MIRHMKRVAQVVVLTAVLVFSGLLIANTDFMTENAEASGHYTGAYHFDKWYNSYTVCYYMVTGYL